MKKFRRRKYLINKPLQFIYSGITVYLLLIGIIIVGLATYYLTLDTILSQLEAQGGFAHAHETVKSINIMLAKRVGIVFLGVALVAFVLGVYYLHRIAGPIFRIEKTLNEMAEGRKVEFVRLRKNDFFKSLANSLNKLIEKEKEKNG